MAVSNHIQLIRGSTTANDKYVGLAGEITVDTTKKTIRIHVGDGKSGGHNIASTIDTVTSATKDDKGNNIADTYARLDGAKFSGTVDFAGADLVTAPTVGLSDKSKKIATTEWVANADCVVHRTGNESISGIKTFKDTVKGVTFQGTTFEGTATRALWADLAENYESDFEYPYGTLVCFGGDKEVTIATEKVNGVVSEKPALLMNRECVTGIPVALAGRVDVLVKGRVSKFDNIILSDVAGIGVVNNEAPIDLVIGKALRDKDEDQVGYVLCVTKFNLL